MDLTRLYNLTTPELREEAERLGVDDTYARRFGSARAGRGEAVWAAGRRAPAVGGPGIRAGVSVSVSASVSVSGSVSVSASASASASAGASVSARADGRDRPRGRVHDSAEGLGA